MSDSTVDEPVAGGIDAQTVEIYLRRHPEFFVERPDLVADLTLPHPVSGGAVSLVERQVAVLREQKIRAEQQLRELARNAAANEQLLARIHHLVLELIEARDLEQLAATLRRLLREEFYADEVVLRVFGLAEGPLAMDADAAALGPVQPLLERGAPVCGRLEAEQCRALFGDRSEEIASAALVPLYGIEDTHAVGFLAIGSLDPERFHAGMGTTFLGHLGAVIAATVRRCREAQPA